MINVGVIGFGNMGKAFARYFLDNDRANIAGVCDPNVKDEDLDSDLAGKIKLYADIDEMLSNTKLDAVYIATPTPLHKDLVIKTLESGLDVLCEKPMALDEESCREMIAAQEKSGKCLQIGHCIRFWPEYVKSKEIIDSGEYGNVKIATFQRLNITPVGWFADGGKSGGAAFDLHIHDADFVQYLFGMPESVSSHGIKGPTGSFDHIVTNYLYDDEKLVTAEGGWMMAPAFGFRMSFNIVLEKATLTYDSSRDPAFTVCPVEGEVFTPEVEKGDGYTQQIEYFIRLVSGEKLAEITTPEQSLNSVRLILAEIRSAEEGGEVEIAL